MNSLIGSPLPYEEATKWLAYARAAVSASVPPQSIRGPERYGGHDVHVGHMGDHVLLSANRETEHGNLVPITLETWPGITVRLDKLRLYYLDR